MFIVALSRCGAAWGDLPSAIAAYGKNDFQTAFEQFKELAELGQPRAQYNLAVLYARGEGVGTSLTYAHAWASLAGKNGEEKGAALAATLEPQLTPTSLQISSDIQAKYSQAALDARLLPRMLDGREYENRDPVRPSKPFVPPYPELARQKGIQGEVFVEFTVAPDGHTRIPRILYAVPGGYFEAAVRDSVMRSVYLPARMDGTAIATSVSQFYHFKMAGVSIHDYGSLEERINATQSKAMAGDPSAEMLYAMMIAGLPQLHQTYAQALPWFLKAAQAGAPYAQYQVGTSLVLGRGCHCEETKGEVWLEKAAQADQADAQVSLAEFLMKDASNRERVAGALVWLERAAKQGNDAAKLYLSSILAANPSAQVRDPGRALALVDSLDHDFNNDPSVWEIRAAAHASRGDFQAAIKAQLEAISRATALGWDLTRLEQRQTVYASQQAWTGNLLQF
jgi:TonB family protein